MKYLISSLVIVFHAFILLAQDPSPEVGLKNGKKILPESLEVKSPLFGGKHLLLNGADKLALDTVDYFIMEDGYFVVRNFRYTSQLVLKREVEGRLPVYSHASPYGHGMVGPNGIMMAPTMGVKMNYYFERHGNLYSLSVKNLKRKLADDAHAMDRIRRIQQGNWVRAGVMIVGGALAVAGLNKMVKEANEGQPPYDSALRPNAGFIVGGLMVIVPLFTFGKKQGKLLEIVHSYNAR